MGEINRESVVDILIPKFAGFLYDKLRGALPLTKAGFIDYSNELKDKGEQVKVAKVGEFLIANQSMDADVTVQDGSLTTDFLTLDNYAPLDFIIRDVSQALTGEDLVKTFAESAAISYANYIEKSFANVFDNNFYKEVGTAAVTGSSGTPTKNIVGTGTKFTKLRSGYNIKIGVENPITGIIDVITDDTHMTVKSDITSTVTGQNLFVSQTVYYANNAKIGDDSIRSARTILAGENVDTGNRILVCNPDDYNDLLDDTHYKDKDSINASILREGSLGRIRSFDTYESNNFQKVYSAAFDPGSIGMAFRVFNTVPSGMADSKIITDPVTKVPMRMTLTWDAGKRGVRISLDLLFGVKMFMPKKTVKVLRAAA